MNRGNRGGPGEGLGGGTPGHPLFVMGRRSGSIVQITPHVLAQKLGRAMVKIIHLDLRVSMLRKIFVTALAGKRHTAMDRKVAAYDAGHSLETQAQYIRYAQAETANSWK